ncbi:MAG: ETC complex I subunit [Alphaproteobacteria bacterium]
MRALIYRPAKTAMQSGRANARSWVLEFERRTARSIDPLMGWTGSGDMMADEVRLVFDSLDDAVAYARRQGLEVTVETTRERRVQPKSYAGNFRWDKAG